MHTGKDLLLQSAARLYTLGVDLEGAREELERQHLELRSEIQRGRKAK